jgi:putative CocE/NonD family hydrolase
LAQDLEVVGPVRLELYVRSSLAHTDFFGRVCDVAPDGTSTNVCDGLFRVAPGRGEVQADGCLRLEIDLWATAYRFRRGHRLRLQVSSGAHPRWSRNLGTGEPLATGVRMAVAEQTVYHDRLRPSALVLPVVEASWQPSG